MYIQKKRIYADDEIMDDMPAVDDMPADMPEDMGEGEVDVAPEAAELLFEAEDVAELVAEVSGEPVEVTVDDDTVTFAVGEAEFVVEPEGDEEVLEATRRTFRGKRTVRASRRAMPARRPVARKPVKASATRRPTARRAASVKASTARTAARRTRR